MKTNYISLIPGTMRIPNLPPEDVFREKESDLFDQFLIRESFEEHTRIEPMSGRIAALKMKLKGWEVVYPNGKVCSKIFESFESARKFVLEVKEKM